MNKILLVEDDLNLIIISIAVFSTLIATVVPIKKINKIDIVNIIKAE